MREESLLSDEQINDQEECRSTVKSVPREVIRDMHSAFCSTLFSFASVNDSFDRNDGSLSVSAEIFLCLINEPVERSYSVAVGLALHGEKLLDNRGRQRH